MSIGSARGNGGELEERLRADVEALAVHDGRVVGSEGHRAARAYLLRRLAELGLEPYAGESFELPYGPPDGGYVNLVARLPGSAPAAERGRPALFAAHYDTCGEQPGADDNAAAIAAALAAAAALRSAPLPCDLVLAFFDAEEPPHYLSELMGSTRFYEDQREDDFRCAVVMDLVGHDLSIPGLEDVLVVTGAERLAEAREGAPPRHLFSALPEPDGLRLLPIRNAYVGDMSDHHAFRVNGAPYLFLTCGEWEHYHNSGDTAARVDYGRVARTSRYLVTLARWLAARDTRFAAEEVGEAEEVARFSEVAGPALAALGLAPRVETGEQVRQIVALLRSQL